jgi:hypothetical protein
MSKLRFTDAEKWRDPWYHGLPLVFKALWQYLTDNCDNAGVWVVNRAEAEFHLGQPIDWDLAAKALSGRVEALSPSKWHLTKFITFQYPGGLSKKSAPHRQVMRLLDHHGLPYRIKEETPPAPTPTPQSSLPSRQQGSAKDKGEGKDEDQSPRGSAEGVELQRAEFLKMLRRLRVADGEQAAERWWYLALDTNGRTFNERMDAIWWAVTEGKARGINVRFASDVEAIAQEWKPPKPKDGAA